MRMNNGKEVHFDICSYEDSATVLSPGKNSGTLTIPLSYSCFYLSLLQTIFLI